MTRMPTMFIPHGGGPCFFMDWTPADAWDKLRHFLQALPETLPDKPKALLVVSGHWEATAFSVQTNPAPPLLYDYHGFPPETYQLSWPAAGDPELAARVRALLGEAGFDTAEDATRGYDHGVFVPLKVAFPDADIPTVQLSLRRDLDAAAHFAAGQALAPLRNDGVLIIGSGNTYHNMRVLMSAMRNPGHATIEGVPFDRFLTQAVTAADPETRRDMLLSWEQAPGARDAAPREEHLLPLHVVAGAAQNDPGVKSLEDHVMGAVESAFTFG